MGPGTHIIERVDAAVMPTSREDFISMTHDINYLLSEGNHYLMDRADDIAMAKAGMSLQGLVMNVGLSARKAFHLKETPQDAGEGRRLKDLVLRNKGYNELARSYGLNMHDLFL